LIFDEKRLDGAAKQIKPLLFIYMKKLILSISLLFWTFHSCSDDAVVDGINLNRGSVNFSLDGQSKNFILLNSYTIDNKDSAVLLAFGNTEDEILTFGFTSPISFPATPSGEDLSGVYVLGEDSYIASNSELLDAGSVALTVTCYENEIMIGTISMTDILITDDTSAADSVIITNGIFENTLTSGF